VVPTTLMAVHQDSFVPSLSSWRSITYRLPRQRNLVDPVVSAVVLAVELLSRVDRSPEVVLVKADLTPP